MLCTGKTHQGAKGGDREGGGSGEQTSKFSRCQWVRASPSDLAREPLAAMPVSDVYTKIQACDQIRRRPREAIGDYIVREQRAFCEMIEARVRNARERKDGRCRRQRHARPGNPSDTPKFNFEIVDDEDGRTDPSSRQELSSQTLF